ncbi:MAG: hypothetical protein IT581_17260 [Verrucomicrobiales bacterium]|nr:hypothetical protein [Verrucomicrobiales bacterium]
MISFRPVATLVALVASLFQASALAQTGTERWEPDIRAFEAVDRAGAIAQGKVMLYGSSSFRMWTNAVTAFPGIAVVNRGFGGSQLSDLNAFWQRVVIPHAPQVLLIYGGDNDIAGGKSAETVVRDFKTLVELVHRDLPRTRIAFVSIKHSPSRLKNLEEQRLANRRVKRWAALRRRVDFLDVASPLLDGDGRPDPRFFLGDRLHLNQEGYEQWRRVMDPYLRRWARPE